MSLKHKFKLTIVLWAVCLPIFSQVKYDPKSTMIFYPYSQTVHKKVLQIIPLYRNISYYKMYNPMTQKTDKISDKIVVNNAKWGLFLRYGVSKKINVAMNIPLENFHKYSPMGIIEGNGFNDISISFSVNLLNKRDLVNSLQNSILITFPTGKYKNLKQNDYPMGLGCLGLTDKLSGFHHFRKLDLLYSAYYVYRSKNFDTSADIGDEIGGKIALQKQFNTKMAHLGIVYGIETHYRFDDKQNLTFYPNKEEAVILIRSGFWYMITKDLYFSTEIPVTILKDKAWFTNSGVIFKINYFINLFNKKTRS